jgi:hypothetical protein
MVQRLSINALMTVEICTVTARYAISVVAKPYGRGLRTGLECFRGAARQM